MIITRSCSVTITVAQMLLYLRKQVDYRRKKLMCTKIGCLYRESLKLFVDLTLFVQKRTPNRSLTMANAFGLSATNLLFLQVVVKGHQLVPKYQGRVQHLKETGCKSSGGIAFLTEIRLKQHKLQKILRLQDQMATHLR